MRLLDPVGEIVESFGLLTIKTRRANQPAPIRAYETRRIARPVREALLADDSIKANVAFRHVGVASG